MVAFFKAISPSRYEVGFLEAILQSMSLVGPTHFVGITLTGDRADNIDLHHGKKLLLANFSSHRLGFLFLASCCTGQ
jgi:hypothetical protein